MSHLCPSPLTLSTENAFHSNQNLKSIKKTFQNILQFVMLLGFFLTFFGRTPLFLVQRGFYQFWKGSLPRRGKKVQFVRSTLQQVSNYLLFPVDIVYPCFHLSISMLFHSHFITSSKLLYENTALITVFFPRLKFPYSPNFPR